MDSYVLNPDQELKIIQAQKTVEQSCIHRYMPNVQLGSYGRFVFLPLSLDPLQYLTSIQAARYGYHDPASMALTAKQLSMTLKGALLAEVDSIDAGTVATFNGRQVPKQGCATEATLAVAHGISVAQRPVENDGDNQVHNAVQHINYGPVQSDSRIIAVNAKWSACMAAGGYHYTNPNAPSTNPEWVRQIAQVAYTHPVTLAEIRTATADVTCRQRVDLYAVYWAVTAAYQKRWLADPANLALAQRQRQVDQLMLTRAEKILAG